MKTIKKCIVVLFSALFTVHTYGGDKYRVQDSSQLLVEVKGVVCSFCAYGTEKNLGRLEIVDQEYFGGDGVLLDLEKASITLALQKDKKISFVNIGKAIEKGGYVTVAIHLKLVGPVVKQNGELFIQNQWNGQLFHLLNKEGEPWKEKTYVGQTVTIQAMVPHSSLHSSLEKQTDSEVPSVRIKELNMAIGEPLQKEEMDMQVINLTVTGMYCSGCVSIVEATLKAMPGVHSVDVNLEDHRATVEVEAGKVKLEKLIETIENDGRFQASVGKEK